MTESANTVNAEVWRRLYSQGANDLRYPNDVLVRIAAKLLDRARDRKLLDFGFGTGANLVHFASQGFDVHGVEISEHALARTRQRLQDAGLHAHLQLVVGGQPLPYPADYFDVVYAWQVLYYNDRSGWIAAVSELERVTKPNGLIIVATAAPGDISQVEAEPLGADLYRSRVKDQDGCLLFIPDRAALAALFAGREIEIGEFGFCFQSFTARFWIITYRRPRAL